MEQLGAKLCEICGKYTLSSFNKELYPQVDVLEKQTMIGLQVDPLGEADHCTLQYTKSMGRCFPYQPHQ